MSNPEEPERICLSPPHMGGLEEEFVEEAFRTNCIEAFGPNVDAFEAEFCKIVGSGHAVALSSGTAALHLALLVAGVRLGDEVFVSTFTTAATVNPILYLGARPLFIDCEPTSWNMDPGLLAEALEHRASIGRLPRAVVVVHLYGQTANLGPIIAACNQYGVPLIEDAAEALGATCKGRSAGTFGSSGIFSFNGNKIITTSGGGMLVSDDADLAAQARALASQTRYPASRYPDADVGYNYRLSNVLAGIGRGQLRVLSERMIARRRNFEVYKVALERIPGVEFMPEARWGRHSRWLTCITMDDRTASFDRETLATALEAENIESRPLWKPMHLQPAFSHFPVMGGAVSEDLFARGICLPSGSSLTSTDLERILGVLLRVARHGSGLDVAASA